MRERTWTLAVRDERGVRHRGIASFGERPPKRPPAPPARFHIALLPAPVQVRLVPAGTAICMPHLARDASIVDASTDSATIAEEIAALKQGRLSDERHAQYRAGEILLPAGRLDAAKVFLRGSRVDLEHLALVLVDMQRAETLAPYLAIIRHELGMPPSANALLALETRLFPADARERPPARAPGIARLRRAAKRLATNAAPDMTLDELTDDLRFLRLFERTEHVLRRDALDRLLDDVAARATPGLVPKRTRARIINLPPRGDA